MLYCLRRYVDGKLVHSSKLPSEIEILYRYMDNYEREWSSNLEFAQLPEAVGNNQGKIVTRVSLDELHVVTTENHILRFVIVPVNGKRKV